MLLLCSNQCGRVEEKTLPGMAELIAPYSCRRRRAACPQVIKQELGGDILTALEALKLLANLREIAATVEQKDPDFSRRLRAFIETIDDDIETGAFPWTTSDTRERVH